MCLAGGIPNAVAMVSPVNDGSNTTRAPCTPESAEKILISTVHESVIGVKSESACLYSHRFLFLKYMYMSLNNHYGKIWKIMIYKKNYNLQS